MLNNIAYDRVKFFGYYLRRKEQKQQRENINKQGLEVDSMGVVLMGQARGIYTFFAHLKWS